LLIPLYDVNGNIWTLEAINTDGEKDFLKGGKKRGGFHPLGKIRGAKRVCIGEGLATVAAVHAVDNTPAAAAMDAGNLLAVAEAVRKPAPDAEIILLADNDTKPDSDDNIGIEAATKAAQAVGGRVAIPELDGQKCDFWDVWKQRGADAVREALNSEPPAQENKATVIDLFDADGKKKSQATLLIELGQAHALFHCPNKDSYALVGKHQAVMALRSRDFREHLSHAFYQLTGKGCNSNAMTDALATLESIAKYNSPMHPVHLRVACLDKTVYLDMGCPNWHVAKITTAGQSRLNYPDDPEQILVIPSCL
jgi:hypothetical protein